MSDAFNSYLYYGMHRSAEGWIFREWAPHATAIYLVGDFSDWQKKEEFRLRHLEYGNWEIFLPADCLRHGMKYRLLVEWEGGCGERIPSHVRRVVQHEETKAFDAQVWFPEAYKWENTYGKTLKNPLIYEGHNRNTLNSRDCDCLFPPDKNTDRKYRQTDLTPPLRS